MATATEIRVRQFGPDSAGVFLSPREFDRAEFDEGSRYELINGVLVVSPMPSEAELDPNDELGHLLRTYRDTHPSGSALNRTIPEFTIRTRKNRRRPDRVIWASLGRRPRKHETPSVIVEFVSPGKRSEKRYYQLKRDEYMSIKVQEYWIIDRFRRTLTVFIRRGSKIEKRVIREHQVYTTDLLPGFELHLKELLKYTKGWSEDEDEPE